MKRIVFLFLAASAAAFAFLFGNEADEINPADLAILATALIAILALQTVLLLLVFRGFRTLGRERLGLTVSKYASAALFACNAFHTAFITFDAAPHGQMLMALAAAGLLLTALLVQKWQSFALFMMTAYFVMSLGLYGYTRLAMRPTAEAGQAPMKISSSRNVYLIGSESLHSAKAFRDLYGARDLPHEDYLRSSGFRVLDRAYSADYTTLRNYARLFDFERDVSDDDIMAKVPFNRGNSTFRMFDDSGYRTQFIYKTTYFGLNPDLVDYAFPKAAFYQCEFVPEEFFYFLCRKPVRKAINERLFGARPLTPDIIRGRLEAAQVGKPWFTFVHLSHPFHTPVNHTYEDTKAVEAFKLRLREALPGIAEKNFAATVGTIVKRDPGAVIIAIGDHGASLTRGADLETPVDQFTQSEILEDRLGVMVAVYPRDFCANRIFEGSTTTYLMESVAKCLNGDDAPTAQDKTRSRIFFWDGKRNLDQYAGARAP